jgi:hypothetical protein
MLLQFLLTQGYLLKGRKPFILFQNLIFIVFVWLHLLFLNIGLWTCSKCGCSQFSSFYSLVESLLVWIYDLWYLRSDILLPMILLSDYFFQTIRAMLFRHVGHSFLQLQTLLFEFKRIQNRHWSRLYDGLLGLLLFCFLFFWSFISGLFLRLFLFCFLFSSSLMRLGLFLHRILLQTFYYSLLRHQRSDFVLEIRLSGIGQWVHSLNTSLLKQKVTI